MLPRRVLDAEVSVRLTPRMSETRSSGDPVRIARAVARRCTRAALATSLNGAPYASLVLLAVDLDASPLLLLSELAQHSRNIAFDPRMSLLLDGTEGLADPLTGPRVSLLGRAQQTDDPRCLARLVSHHPASAAYAGFRDFHLYRVAVERGHLVAGFGRIDWIDGADFLFASDAGTLAAAESEILRHMNEDHGDTVADYARALLGRAGTGWRMTGIDPEGIDLRRQDETARLDFAAPVEVPVLTPDAARAALVQLADAARQ
jgi:heme oxygenase (biliverdin-IX-beta and delta-forming)